MYQEIQESQPTSSFDLSVLSPKAQRHLMQYADEQATLAMSDTISIQRVMLVTNRAIAAYVAISQTAAAAVQTIPYESERIERIMECAHNQLCNILDGEKR